MHKITNVKSRWNQENGLIPDYCETVKIDNPDDLNEFFEDFGIPYKGKWKRGIWHLVYDVNNKNKDVKFYLVSDSIGSNMYYSGYICAIHITRLIRN